MDLASVHWVTGSRCRLSACTHASTLPARPSPRRLVRRPVRGTQTGWSVSDPRRLSLHSPVPIPTPSRHLKGLRACVHHDPARVWCPRLAWLLGLVLLVGLTACGSPSPDAPRSGHATGSAGADGSPPAGDAASLAPPPTNLPATIEPRRRGSGPRPTQRRRRERSAPMRPARHHLCAQHPHPACCVPSRPGSAAGVGPLVCRGAGTSGCRRAPNGARTLGAAAEGDDGSGDRCARGRR